METSQTDDRIHFSQLFKQEDIAELYTLYAKQIETKSTESFIQIIMKDFLIPNQEKIMQKLIEHSLALDAVAVALFLQEHCHAVYFGKIGLTERTLTLEEKIRLASHQFFTSGLEDDTYELDSVEAQAQELRTGVSEKFIDYAISGLLLDYTEIYKEHFLT